MLKPCHRAPQGQLFVHQDHFSRFGSWTKYFKRPEKYTNTNLPHSLWSSAGYLWILNSQQQISPPWDNSWWRHQMETFSALLTLCSGNSPVTGRLRGVSVCSLIFASTNGRVNKREAGDLRRHRAHYDVIVMWLRNKYNVSCSFR